MHRSHLKYFYHFFLFLTIVKFVLRFSRTNNRSIKMEPRSPKEYRHDKALTSQGLRLTTEAAVD